MTLRLPHSTLALLMCPVAVLELMQSDVRATPLSKVWRVSTLLFENIFSFLVFSRVSQRYVGLSQKGENDSNLFLQVPVEFQACTRGSTQARLNKVGSSANDHHGTLLSPQRSHPSPPSPMTSSNFFVACLSSFLARSFPESCLMYALKTRPATTQSPLVRSALPLLDSTLPPRPYPLPRAHPPPPRPRTSPSYILLLEKYPSLSLRLSAGQKYCS